jgi:hypothetical protein
MDIYDGDQKTYDAGKTTAFRIYREQRGPGRPLTRQSARRRRLPLRARRARRIGREDVGLRRVPDLPSFMRYAVMGRYCGGCRHGHAT